jgi:hypothetical protein
MMVSLFLAQSTFAAKLDVNWLKPETYHDIRAGEQNRKTFQKRTFKILEKHLMKLASKLSHEQTLKITIHDLDLAGEIDFSATRQIRILREPYSPRVTLSYQLLEGNEKVIVAGDDKLKNMSFLQSNNLHYRNESLGHEKKMLDKWFKGVFFQFIEKQ